MDLVKVSKEQRNVKMINLDITFKYSTKTPLQISHMLTIYGGLHTSCISMQLMNGVP
jgi:hypothetical protein